MPVNFGKTFSSAFKYAFDFKRILPFFIINLVMVAFVLIFIDAAINLLPLVMSSGWTSLPLTTIAYAALALLVIVALITLLRIFFQAAITDNARFYWQGTRKKLSKSFPVAKKKYLTVLLTLILAGLISGFANTILSFIPVFGGFLSLIASILLGLIFLFLIQIIVVSNKGIVDSLKEGYRLFMRSKLDVFIFWLVLAILSGIIFIVAIIPIGIALIPILAPLVESLTGNAAGIATVLENAITLIKANMLGLGIAGVISALIVSYLTVFQESAKTFFYMQKKK